MPILLLALILSACSLSPAREAANRERAATAEQKLRIGESYEEVRKDFPELGNCRGSAKSLQVCQLNYAVGSTIAMAGRADSGSMAKEKYRVYTLSFEKGLLKNWVPEEESRVRE